MSKIPNYYGYNPPFFGGHQNVLSKQSGQRIIKNDLQQLILTSPGERVMRPSWGTIVKQSLFEPMTSDLIANIQDNINTAILTYETRVKVSVSVTFDSGNNAITIKLIGTYTNLPNTTFEQEISLPLPTAGG